MFRNILNVYQNSVSNLKQFISTIFGLYLMIELYILEPSYNEFRSKTSPFMVETCIMITQ